MDDIRSVSAVPTVQTSGAYTAAYAIGGKLSFDVAAFKNDGLGFVLDQVLIVDLARQSANVDLVLFSSDPTGTTFTDNAELDIADADMAKIAAVVNVTTHATFKDNSISKAGGALGIPIRTAAETLYGVLVARATPTFAGAADVRVSLALRATR